MRNKERGAGSQMSEEPRARSMHASGIEVIITVWGVLRVNRLGTGAVEDGAG